MMRNFTLPFLPHPHLNPNFWHAAAYLSLLTESSSNPGASLLKLMAHSARQSRLAEAHSQQEEASEGAATSAAGGVSMAHVPLAHTRQAGTAAAAAAGSVPEAAQESSTGTPHIVPAESGDPVPLIKLVVHGAKRYAHAAELVLDPLDSCLDLLADTGTEIIMKQLHKHPSKAVLSHAISVEEPLSPTMAAGSSGWAKLRRAVMSVGSFTHLLKVRARDDSNLPSPGVNPAHAKALSLCLSVMMSGAVSGVIGGATPDFASPFSSLPQWGGGGGGAPTELVVTKSSTGEATTHSFQSAASFTRAPSVMAARVSVTAAAGGSATEGVVSMGGMAASTAMKLLRADSKRIDAVLDLDLDKILGSVLDTVHEFTDGVSDGDGGPHMGDASACTA